MLSRFRLLCSAVFKLLMLVENASCNSECVPKFFFASFHEEQVYTRIGRSPVESISLIDLSVPVSLHIYSFCLFLPCLFISTVPIRIRCHHSVSRLQTGSIFDATSV